DCGPTIVLPADGSLLDGELARLHHHAAGGDLQLVLAGRPAVGLADAEVGGLGAGGDDLVLGVDDLAVLVGPGRGQVAADVAVGGDRGVDGVAAGKAAGRHGDAVVLADFGAQVDGGDGHRRRGGGFGRRRAGRFVHRRRGAGV